MLAKVGLVIAQRDGVVKRLFEMKEYEQTAFAIDERTDGKNDRLFSFCTRGNQPGFRQHKEKGFVSIPQLKQNLLSERIGS